MCEKSVLRTEEGRITRKQEHKEDSNLKPLIKIEKGRIIESHVYTEEDVKSIFSEEEWENLTR